jgi:hypothetical protein
VVVLFEPLPPPNLLPLLEQFAGQGGKVVWSGPPPRLDFTGRSVLDSWCRLFGVSGLAAGHEGSGAAGSVVAFEGRLRSVPSQAILTDFLVDFVYPVQPRPEAEVVARAGNLVLGSHRSVPGGGSLTFLGFRPRDDQAASLGYETRTWYDLLAGLGSYPKSRTDLVSNDNPSVVSRESPYLATHFPNGTTVIAAHYRRHVESWPGGFHRDAKQDAEILARNPLPSDRLDLRNFLVNGYNVTYRGTLIVGFRIGAKEALIGFSGQDCDSIELNGRQYLFADRPMPHIAWAPVAEDRRVPHGAIMELWSNGASNVSVPVPEPTRDGQLVFEGARPGSAGAAVPTIVKDGLLQFQARADWPQKHLYWVA